MRMCCSLSGCADVCVAARTCVWLRGRVCGCADVCVAARTCVWLRGRVRDRRQGFWSGPQGTERTRATLR